MNYQPTVLFDSNRRPIIIYSKGRTKYRAVAADEVSIKLVELETLCDLVHAMRNGEPYPPKRAASFWLNHDHREITKRAREVLRNLVSRK